MPRVDVHTKNTRAGEIAANAVWRVNARTSANAAMHQTAITASRIAPSVAGAGAGAVRSRCQPPENWCCSACHVSPLGSPAVVVDSSTASTTYTARPTTVSTTPIQTDHPRHRRSAPSAWGSSAAPTTGRTKRLESTTRPSDSAATTLSTAKATGAKKRARRTISGSPHPWRHAPTTARGGTRARASRSTRSGTAPPTHRRRRPTAAAPRLPVG